MRTMTEKQLQAKLMRDVVDAAERLFDHGFMIPAALRDREIASRLFSVKEDLKSVLYSA